ncbi:ATP-binding cassette sub-family A member 3 [Folsomia candida]|uniref:ATP-binding cassette sub-family A member 3 n=1 Tax=Folsomia candida TaxID=158441 RepID=A0A226CXI7_FOLCA|nr:ATP-binding cassette sub-family A member 3 [Folsomia candida]
MTSGIKKFGLLLWKNYILQKRHKIQTVMELLVPLFFTAVLVAIRGLLSSTHVNHPTVFYPWDVDMANGTSVPKGCHILYSPRNTLTDMLMNGANSPMVEKYFPRGGYNYTVHGYDTEDELVEAYTATGFPNCKNGLNDTERNTNLVLAAIVFRDGLNGNSWTDVNEITYALRFPAVQHNQNNGDDIDKPRWMTELLYPIFQVLGPRENPEWEKNTTEEYFKFENEHHGGRPGYWAEGFLYFQHAVDTSIRKFISPTENIYETTVQLERMPYPKFIDDVFLIALQNFLPLIIVFSFIYPVINITKSIAHEKEKRLKESMKMMGLPNWLHWLAWFIKSFFFIIISIILMVVLIKIKFYDDGELAVLTKSDGSLLFVFLLIYSFSMVTLSFFISTLFSTANSAATAAGVIFFLSYFPYTFLQQRYDTLGKSTKVLTSLLSNTGLSFGCQIISMWEGAGAGVQWSNLPDPASPDDNWSFLDVNIILFVDGILYLLLALYVEGVWPGDYGLPMPWYFPFTSWYWCGTPRGDETIAVTSVDTRQKYPQNFEKEPNGKAGVQIKGLTKVFGPKTAVNNLYLNMFDNQITALLGHNGAGKTTTMSMLTGLFPPTTGTAIVNGYDIRHDIQSVRDNLGLCPQHDVLFDEMTVSEHLRFFGILKGCDAQTLDKEVARMLKAVNLEAKADAQAMSLSGGMKRRLSVGIAFVGGSRVVLLDEPSSGLDPGARRQIWDLIQLEKKNRTIILSTHFMDEADLLGDRIAILAEGTVQCCGSSLFLKKKYGGGYHLIIVKKTHCDVDRITDFLRLRVPHIEIDQNVGSELSYSLPDDLSYLFADMFEELEQRKEELGIASYGARLVGSSHLFTCYSLIRTI